MEQSRGFTLLDLLISLAIFAIASGYAIPNLLSFSEKAKANSISAQIQRSLLTARQFAIAKDSDVTICGVDDENSCTKSNFRSIAIFFDQNNDQNLSDDDSAIFVSKLPNSGQIKLSASFGRSFIKFKPDGSSEQAGSFIYCNAKYPNHARRVTVSMAGRSYAGRDLDKDGIVEKVNGKAIQC